MELNSQKKHLAALRADHTNTLAEVASLRSDRAALTQTCEQLRDETSSLKHLATMAKRDGAVALSDSRRSQYWAVLFMGTTVLACGALLASRRSGAGLV